MIGVSALVYDEKHVYLAIDDPVAWYTDTSGVTTVPLVCIGGRLKPGEGLLDCLAREGREEIGVPLRPVRAPATRLIFEGRLHPGGYTDGAEPLPWIYTIASNRLPGAAEDVVFLVIVTYLAHTVEKPTLGDIFGLVAIPKDALRMALPVEPIPWQDLCRQAGATLTIAGELPRDARCVPALSARSIHLLLEDDKAARESSPDRWVIDSR